MKNVKLYPVVKHAKKQVFSMVRAVFSITYFRLTRYNFSGAQGKSGSVRVCYTDFDEYEVTYLITAFTKKEQENLTEAEKSVLKKLVKALKEESGKRRSVK